MSSSEHGPEFEEALADLVDEIIDHLQAGGDIDLLEYQRLYPQYADRIESLIPTLRLLGDVKDIPSGDTVEKNTVDGSIEGLSGQALLFDQLGDFQIVREIGRGGMGIVYEAMELTLNRRVALKVLPFAAISNERQLARFHVEAQAAAGLQHQGIVPVYSVGCDRGVHFYSMQYIDGVSLASVLNEKRMPSTRQSTSMNAPESAMTVISDRSSRSGDGIDSGSKLSSGDVGFESAGETDQYFRSMVNLAIQAAEAIEHAHQSGVIHRDIKPGNLLLDGEDRLWITDFGLARIEQDSELTLSGDLVGTIRYMSPEQATSNGSLVDHRCDVYSLGATLYELLTLRPAFVGEDRQGLLSQIIHEEPTVPSKWMDRIPMDLDTIVMKSLEKDLDARYQSASEMANDLRCFLEDRPISARRPSGIVRIRKWGRRHPAIVRSSVAMLAVVAIAWIVGSVLLLQQKSKTEDALAQVSANFEQSELNRTKAEDAVEDLNQLLYVRGLGLAAKAWQEGDGAGAAALMRSNPANQLKPNWRGFEWHYLDSLLSAPNNQVFRSDEELTSSAISSDGKLIVIGDANGTIRLIRDSKDPILLQGHDGPVHSLDLSPNDARLVSSGEDGTIRIWDVFSGKTIKTVDAAHGQSPVFAVRYSNSGDRLASGGSDGQVRLWDPVSMGEKWVMKGHTREIRAVEFSPDDAKIASGSNDRDVRIWDVSTGNEIRVCRGHTGMVLSLVFSADGRYLISGSNDHTIRFWNHSSGQQVSVVREHHDGVQALAVLADGGIVAGDRGGNLHTWRIRGKKIVDRFWDDGSMSFSSIQLAPDGQSCAGLTSDGDLLLRDLASGRTRVLLSGLSVQDSRAEREQMVFSADGSKLFCKDRIVSLSPHWDGELRTPLQLKIPVSAPGCFSPDGNLVAVGIPGGIQLFDAETGQSTRELTFPMEALFGVRFSQDGKHVLGWALNGPIVRWNWETGRVVESIDHPHEQVVDLEESSDGSRIVTCAATGEVSVRDLGTSQWRDLDLGECRCSSVSWYDQGVTLALSSPGLQDFLYRLAPDGMVEMLAVNQDAQQTGLLRRHRLFVSNHGGEKVEILDLSKLEVVAEPSDFPQGHTDRIWSVSVAEDGKQMVTASRDGTLRRWSQPQDRWQWLTRRRHIDNRVKDFGWSSDQSQLAIAEIGCGQVCQCLDGTLQHSFRWYGRSGPDAMGFAFVSIAIVPKSNRLVTGNRDGSIRLWDKIPGPPNHVVQAMPIDSEVTAIVHSPNERYLAACSRAANVVSVFRTDTWETEWSKSADDCDSVAFSSSGDRFAYCDGLEAVLVSVGDFSERYRLGGHSLTVNGVAFSPDDRKLVTACEDRKLRIWNLNTGKLEEILGGHTAPVNCATFSVDGATLVSADSDGVIKLWHLATGQELYTLADLGFGIKKLSFDASGRVLVVLSSDGHVHVFDAGSPGAHG